MDYGVPIVELQFDAYAINTSDGGDRQVFETPNCVLVDSEPECVNGQVEFTITDGEPDYSLPDASGCDFGIAMVATAADSFSGAMGWGAGCLGTVFSGTKNFA